MEERPRMKPKISVVITVFNDAFRIGNSVRAVMAQPLPPGTFECVVVDDGSTDNSSEVARNAGARIVRLEKNSGIGAARNAGAAAAQADWVALTDADCVVSRRWLASLLAEIEKADASVLAVAGKIHGLDSRTPASRFIDLVGGLDAATYLKHDTMPWAPGGNVAYRREHLLAEPFDARLNAYETAELHLRLTNRFGGRVVYAPTALVLHEHRKTWRALWKQQRNYGVGYAQFIFKHADRWPWGIRRELRQWRHLMGFVLRSCWKRGDAGLAERGSFVKYLALRVGFLSVWFSRDRLKRRTA